MGSPSTSIGVDDVRELAAGFSPEVVADALRRCGPRYSGAGARDRGGARGGGVRPDRHVDRRVRHPGQLAGRRRQRPHRQPRPARRSDVPASPSAPRPDPPGPAADSPPAAGTAGSPDTPRRLSELPAAALAEEIDTAGRRSAQGDDHDRGQSGAVGPGRRPVGRALDGVGFMLSVDPYLNETTRHADVILPPPPPSQSRAFRLRAEQRRGAQQRPLLAAGAAAGRRAARRGRDPVPASR